MIKHLELTYKRSVRRLLWVPRTLTIFIFRTTATVSSAKTREKLPPWLLKIETQGDHAKGQKLSTKKVILRFTFNEEILKLGKYHPIAHKGIPVLAVFT